MYNSEKEGFINMENQESKKICLKPIAITMAILLLFIGVYYFYNGISGLMSLENMTEQASIIFATFQGIIFLLSSAAVITFGILALINLLKGKCSGKYLRFGLLVFPSTVLLVDFLLLMSNNLTTGASIGTIIIAALWSIAIIVLLILAFVNLNNNKKLFDIIASGLNIAYILYTIFVFSGSSLNAVSTIVIFSLLAFSILYLIKTLLNKNQCCCEKCETKQEESK